MSRKCRTRAEALAFLTSRINYERMAGGGYGPDDVKLERMRRLLGLLGDPQERLPVIHVAGTKGKGSTSIMIAEILRAAGYTPGLFTSPHISSFEERMTVAGVPPDGQHLRDLVNRLVDPVAQIDQLSKEMGSTTYFELATAMAWLYFVDRGADVAVLEVGLGGRLDATNICSPLVTVITNISRDHTNVLGSTTIEIAKEKAGIVKAGIPLVCGVGPSPARDAIAEICRQRRSVLYRLGEEIRWRRAAGRSPAPYQTRWPGFLSIDVETPWSTLQGIPVPLQGEHQGANAALAYAATSFLDEPNRPINADAVHRGLANVRWPARIEVVGRSPTVVIDAAHNWASAQALVRTLATDFTARRRILIFAATRDKDVRGMLRLLVPAFDSVVLTQYHSNPRGLSIEELRPLVEATTTRGCHVAANPKSALELATRIATPDDLICVTGSFFIATDIRELLVPSSVAAPQVVQETESCEAIPPI